VDVGVNLRHVEPLMAIAVKAALRLDEKVDVGGAVDQEKD